MSHGGKFLAKGRKRERETKFGSYREARHGGRPKGLFHSPRILGPATLLSVLGHMEKPASFGAVLKAGKDPGP
jgi:hypothetical protein